MSMSEAELAGLSDEEREALAGDEDETEIVGEGDDEDTDDAAPVVEATAPTDAVVSDAADEDPPFVPRFTGPDAAGVDEKLTAIEADRATLYTTHDDGDLTTAELREKLSALDAQKDELRSQKIQAEIAVAQAAQTSTQRWEWEVSRFMRAQAKDGTEYRMDVAERVVEAARKANDPAKLDEAEASFTRTQALSAALDAQVKRLAGDEANEDKPQEWFLEEAHKRVARAFNLTKPAAVQPADDPMKAALNKRRPDLKAVPSTIAHLPNAGGEDASVGEGKFADLDKMNGLDLERAIARMSTEEQQEYARAS